MVRKVDGPEITGQVVHKQTGQAYGPVTVTVSPKVYTDPEMTASVTSLTTDGTGVFSCYAPPGNYTFTTTAVDAQALEPVEVLGREGGTGGAGSAASLPVGGTTGQVLKKNSNADNDAGWGNAAQASNATPANLGTAAAGTGTAFSRDDHTHSLANLETTLDLRYAKGLSVTFVKVTRSAGAVSTSSATFGSIDGAGGLNMTLSGVVAGQVVMIQPIVLWNTSTVNGRMDVETLVSGSHVNYISASAGNGVPTWIGSANTYAVTGSPFFYVLQAGDISGGSVTFRPVFKSDTGGTTVTVLADAGAPLSFVAALMG